MTHTEQIALMETAEARIEGYFQRWLQYPDLKAALHRHDPDGAKRAATTHLAAKIVEILDARGVDCRCYPLECGGIQFEFEKGSWSLSIEVDEFGTIEMYGVRSDGPGEMQPATFGGLGDDFIDELDRRICATKPT